MKSLTYKDVFEMWKRSAYVDHLFLEMTDDDIIQRLIEVKDCAYISVNDRITGRVFQFKVDIIRRYFAIEFTKNNLMVHLNV